VETVVLTDLVEQIMQKLDSLSRRAVELRLQGHTLEEIAGTGALQPGRLALPGRQRFTTGCHAARGARGTRPWLGFQPIRPIPELRERVAHALIRLITRLRQAVVLS
jgi:hypothetical protein